jgi:hypothetical protein
VEIETTIGQPTAAEAEAPTRAEEAVVGETETDPEVGVGAHVETRVGETTGGERLKETEDEETVGGGAGRRTMAIPLHTP